MFFKKKPPTPEETCKANLQEIEIESCIDTLQDSISKVILCCKGSNNISRLLETINNLCQLELDGEHNCYIEDKLVKLVFKKGALVEIQNNI